MTHAMKRSIMLALILFFAMLAISGLFFVLGDARMVHGQYYVTDYPLIEWSSEYSYEVHQAVQLAGDGIYLAWGQLMLWGWLLIILSPVGIGFSVLGWKDINARHGHDGVSLLYRIPDDHWTWLALLFGMIPGLVHAGIFMYMFASMSSWSGDPPISSGSFGMSVAISVKKE